jgi:sporulation protein YlmC with PRC-barrel domain/DNA-directed RNA polymerase subunit RPC12/RpoP
MLTLNLRSRPQIGWNVLYKFGKYSQNMMSEDEDLREKKLRGSGGFVIAHVSDEEQKKGNLGGPELFLAGIGRLPSERFVKYHCNKCDKDYSGSPDIRYDKPNEDVGEGVILKEKGEYKCHECSSVIAQYRKFDSPTTKVEPAPSKSQPQKKSKSVDNQTRDRNQEQSVAEDHIGFNSSLDEDGFILMDSLIGMPAYDSEAMLVGNIKKVGLRRSAQGRVDINFKISKEKSGNSTEMVEITWNNISKIGDIVLLTQTKNQISSLDSKSSAQGESKIKCPSCNFDNEGDALFCADCGKKLS